MTASMDIGASDVRELTADEIIDVAGALRIQLGSFYLAVNEMDMKFSMGFGKLNLSVFDDGQACVRMEGVGSHCF